jgi:quinol monooxygenase YgiN
MLHVIAAITAQPGKRQNILDLLHPALPMVRKIPGCLEYTVVVDADVAGAMHTPTKVGPDTFVCIEKWESQEHLEAHATAPESAEYFKAVEPFFKSRVVNIFKSSE